MKSNEAGRGYNPATSKRTATETNDSQPHNWRDHSIARTLYGPILRGEC
jgi:hypothetical protein